MKNNFEHFLDHYLVGKISNLEELKNLFDLAEKEKRIAVILVPGTNQEHDLLLSNLPPSPPIEAKIAAFTSGSSGHPKAVFHSEKSLTASAKQLVKVFSEVKNILCFLPPWGMAGMMFQYFFPRELKKNNPAVNIFYPGENLVQYTLALQDFIQLNNIDLCIFNPFIVQNIIERSEANASALANSIATPHCRFVSLTAPLREKQKEAFAALFGAPIEEIYGMTETAGPILWNGNPLGSEISLSADGELQISGQQLFLGYGFSRTFAPCVAPFPTGDIADATTTHGTKTFKICGRKKDYINIGGKKIAPRWIEELVLQHNTVKECLAFALSNPSTDSEQVAIAISISDNFSEPQFIEHLKKTFSQNQRPIQWHIFTELPKLSSAKIDKKKILEELS